MEWDILEILSADDSNDLITIFLVNQNPLSPSSNKMMSLKYAGTSSFSGMEFYGGSYLCEYQFKTLGYDSSYIPNLFSLICIQRVSLKYKYNHIGSFLWALKIIIKP